MEAHRPAAPFHSSMHSPAKTKMHRKRQGEGGPRVRERGERRGNPRRELGFRSKKVRAKDIMTPQQETSESERWEEARAEGAGVGKGSAAPRQVARRGEFKMRGFALVSIKKHMNKPKYFLYARKSTEEDDRQVMSIEAQLFELRELARKEELEILEEFQESKSAKTPGARGVRRNDGEN